MNETKQVAIAALVMGLSLAIAMVVLIMAMAQETNVRSEISDLKFEIETMKKDQERKDAQMVLKERELLEYKKMHSSEQTKYWEALNQKVLCEQALRKSQAAH